MTPEKLPEKTDKEQRIKARIIRQTTHAHEQAKKANDHAIKFRKISRRRRRNGPRRGVCIDLELVVAVKVDAIDAVAVAVRRVDGVFMRVYAREARPRRLARPLTRRAGRRREEGQGRQGLARAGREAPEGGGGLPEGYGSRKRPRRRANTPNVP